MSTVRGKVLYKDGSVPRGLATIALRPTPSSTAPIKKTATGTVESDGSFELMTYKPGDGAFHGEYDVIISNIKSLMDPQPLIADKYGNPQESGFPPVTIDGAVYDLKFEVEPLSGAR